MNINAYIAYYLTHITLYFLCCCNAPLCFLTSFLIFLLTLILLLVFISNNKVDFVIGYVSICYIISNVLFLFFLYHRYHFFRSDNMNGKLVHPVIFKVIDVIIHYDGVAASSIFITVFLIIYELRKTRVINTN